MEAYEAAFRKQGCTVAQMLLTKDDFVNRSRYMNARNTLRVLFEKGVVPIINENDSVAVDEIKLGDNDNLSALVASLIEGDLLIILSDIDGLFSDDPTHNSNAQLIPVIEKITAEIEKLAKKSRGELSTGGMITKIQAAKRCASSGVAMMPEHPTVPVSAPGEGNCHVFLWTVRRISAKPWRSMFNAKGAEAVCLQCGRETPGSQGD